MEKLYQDFTADSQGSALVLSMEDERLNLSWKFKTEILLKKIVWMLLSTKIFQNYYIPSSRSIWDN